MTTRTLLLLVSLAVAPSVLARTPVGEHGALAVKGAAIVGEHGRPVSLAGVSFFWSQWQGDFWNKDVVDWLVKDWRVTIVRAAMGVEAGGYLRQPDVEQKRVEQVVDAAIAAGIYVIIDWHDHHATRHSDEAVRFFSHMARKYGGNPHVIYEIFNEPLDHNWSKEIKPYAETVIAAIRAEDPDNLVVVGTPRWCQDVESAAKDRLKGTNLVYALHFYAGTHQQALRAAAERVLADGLPLMVSEWGSCNANGDGPIDHDSTARWFELIRKWNLTHCVWAVSAKRESASVVIPTASRHGRWADSDLTEGGRLARDLIRGWVATPADAAGADRK